MHHVTPPSFRTSLAAVVLALGAAAAWAAPVAPALTVTLKPRLEAGQADIGSVEVSVVLDRAQPATAEPLLRMAQVVMNVETVARSAEVFASDDLGDLPLKVSDEGEGARAVRSWTPARPVRGKLSYRYSATITNQLAPRGAAPPFELRSEAGAFSGAGESFLLLPYTQEPHRLALHWDLSSLPAGARGVSSLGAGDVLAAQAVPPARLAQSFYMAGRIGTYPERPVQKGFFAAWQGDPPFDARALLQWTEQLHARYSAFFGDHELPTYGVFVRRNKVNPGGGVELSGSFVATYDVVTKASNLRILMAHDMLHTWAPSITEPDGLESSWFGEGLAVVYQRALPWRFGMIESQAFLDDVNFHAGRYYTNLLGDVANDQVPLRFWEDTRIRTIPYDRGSFYLVTVDDAVRKHSGGRRSLDDLMLEMKRQQQQGKALSNADWEALLARELGDGAVADFRAMLAGKWMLPASDAFGPCFRRVAKRMRRYELGFDPKVLVEPRRIIRGLVPGSAAARAGLLDGDEILQPVGQDHLQGEQEREIELKIRRDGRDFVQRYLPRGETVDAWQWERDPAAPAADCR